MWIVKAVNAMADRLVPKQSLMARASHDIYAIHALKFGLAIKQTLQVLIIHLTRRY
jgi:hypothetical protein